MIKQCVYCGCEYITEDKRQKYCCIEHAYKDRKSHKITVQCAYCGKDKAVFPSRIIDGKKFFCNKNCHDLNQKILVGSKNSRWGGKNLARVCEFCHKTYKPSKSSGDKRKRSYKYCSNMCRLNALFEIQQKEDHPSWKGGITPYRRTVETTAEYKRWRLNVFKRDKYRCVICGSTRKLCAHHIKTFADYPELRTDLNNGITLCESCHGKTYSKESYYENYFYEMLSFLKDFCSFEVRLANVC